MYKNKRILAFIPARSGSKRLPQKNKKLLKNKPLFMWTINEAMKSKYLDKLIVSTDDKEIGNKTKKIKSILTVKRKKVLANDKTQVEKVVHDYLSNNILNYELVCVLQPTSPLRKAKDIDDAIKSLVKSKHRSLISVCGVTKKSKFIVGVQNGLIEKKIKNNNKFKLNGAIYLSYIHYFIKYKTFFSNKTIAFKMPKSRSIDIDTDNDFKKIEKFLN